MARSRAHLTLAVSNAYRLSQFGDDTADKYRLDVVGEAMPAARLVAVPVNDAPTRARKARALQRMRHEDALDAWRARVKREARMRGLPEVTTRATGAWTPKGVFHG